MKTIKVIITIFIIQLFNLHQDMLSQYIWSSLQKITETNAYDQHPSFGTRLISNYGGIKSMRITTMMTFDRTDSIGTNICVLNVDNQGWSQDVQYITQGNGKNEFPSLALGYSSAMLVYQSKQGNGHNIFCSIYDSISWSAPYAITNDIDQENIHPNVSTYFYPKDLYAVVWEKNGKICWRGYNGSLWSDVINITPNDSLNNTNPVCNYNQIIWQRSKYSNQNQYDLYYAYCINNIWKYDSITTLGNNVFPIYSNDRQEIYWGKSTGERWEIYCSSINISGKLNFVERVVSDSIMNCKELRVVCPPLPNSYSKQIFNYINKETWFNIAAGVWIQEIDTSQDIVLVDLFGRKQIMQLEDSQKNPTIGAFKDGNGYRVWAVWESNHTGKWGLYGLTYYIPISSVEEPKNDMGYSLYQNYPNPFNPSTVINYQLPINSFVTLKIYNILGKEITTLVNEKQVAGTHSIIWEAKNVPAGIYFYRLQTEKYCGVRKMVLVK